MIERSAPTVAAITQEYFKTLGGGGLEALEEYATGEFPIALARTVLQAHMAAMLKEGGRYAECSFAMVLDDDKRLPRDSFLSAQYFFKLDTSAIYVGRDCKAAPNTLAYGLRVQLLDLWFSVATRSPHEHEPLPEETPATERAAAEQAAPLQAAAEPSAQTRLLHSETSCALDPADAYYDLSTSRYDHLEEPQLVRLTDLGAACQRVRCGDPLARDCVPSVQKEETTQRGGCMLLFRENFDCLVQPQFTPELPSTGGKHAFSRRSDSIWLAVQSRRGVRCVALPALYVLHESGRDSLALRGKLRSNALAETWGAVLCRSAADRAQYLHERVCAMHANNERIRGLLSLLRALGRTELKALISELELLFDAEAWESEVFLPLRNATLRSRMLAWSPLPLLEAWGDASQVVTRVFSAECVMQRARVLDGQPSGELRFVGQGREGVVFRIGACCYKVFDTCVDAGSETDLALELLHQERVRSCERLVRNVLRYEFVPGRTYRGGHGQAVVALLRHLRERKLVMTNITPANLVVAHSADAAAPQIEIVDLGRSWALYSRELWVSMCRRAFLCWRFGRWCTAREGEKQLKLFLSAERSGDFFPELTGFGRFLELCDNGPSPFTDEERFERRLCNTSAHTQSLLTHGAFTQSTTFLIKTCLMEAATLVLNVRHLVWTLQRAGTRFAEIVLVVDRTRRVDLQRQYTAVDEEAFDVALGQVRGQKLVNRVVDFDGLAPETAPLVRRLNAKYLGHASLATHSANGTPHAPLFAALETITTELVLQVDADIILNMSTPEDLVARAYELFDRDTRAVTMAGLPIFGDMTGDNQVFGFRYIGDDGGAFRMEIRFSFLHLRRLREMLPFGIPETEHSEERGDTILRRGWYRVFDWNVAKLGLRSYRFCSTAGLGYFLHPPNELKRCKHDYALLVNRIAAPDVVRSVRCKSRGQVPAQAAWRKQSGSVDVVVTEECHAEWFGERAEQLVFVCCGRNVPYGRALRCLESLSAQRGAESVGVVLLDDASDEDPAPLFEAARLLFPGRVSCIYTGLRLRSLRATSHSIRRVCVNPSTVVCLLDLDDMLLEQKACDDSVVESIRHVFWDNNGAPRMDRLVAIGGMVRDSKFKRYPLCTLENPRDAPGASNVWSHLRCFRKFLFDAIDEDNFRSMVGGQEHWLEHGADWAFMVPIVEQAGADRVFEFSSRSLYFYEASPWQDDPDKCAELEKVQAFLRARPRFTRRSDADCASHLTQLRLLTQCHLPVSSLPGAACELLHFRTCNGLGLQCLVRGYNMLAGRKLVPVRIHSECFTGDVLGSRRCDCGEQLQHFLREEMSSCECAVLVYVQGHEGRGNGLVMKQREYARQDVEPRANHIDILKQLGGKADKRSYIACASLLRTQLQISSVVLHTNNEAKYRDVEAVFGPANVRPHPVCATINGHNAKYLYEKVDHMGHDRRLVDSCGEKFGEAVSEFVSFIGLEAAGAKDPSYTVLCKVVHGMLERPFHNLEILASGASSGPEGVCFDRNCFLAHVLVLLGFTEVQKVGAYTEQFLQAPKNKLLEFRGLPLPLPNHICLIVGVSNDLERGGDFLVDVGNARPYFTPLRLPDDDQDERESFEAHHLSLDYRLRRLPDNSFAMEHRHRRVPEGAAEDDRHMNYRYDWQMNYRFKRTRCLRQDEIESIVNAHVCDPHYGHMLHSLRLSKWSLDGNSVVLRDTQAQIIASDGSSPVHVELRTSADLRSFVQTHFGAELLGKLHAAAPILLEYLSLMHIKSDAHASPLMSLLKELCPSRMTSGLGSARKARRVAGIGTSLFAVAALCLFLSCFHGSLPYLKKQ